MNRRRVGLGAAALVVAVAVLVLYREVWHPQREYLVALGEQIPAWLLLLAFLILPLFGAPISLFLLIVGIRFGFGWGALITAGAMISHHVATFKISHGFFREKLLRWCKKKSYTIPPIDPRRHALFAAVFAAVHGPPYIAKLYLMALTDIPLRTHLLVGAPVYIVFALPLLAFGEAFLHMKVVWLIVFATVVVGTLVLGRWAKDQPWTTAKKPEDEPPG